MTSHSHVPGRITGIINENNHLDYYWGVCRCRQAVKISRYRQTFEPNSVHLQWDPIDDWRTPSADEAEEIEKVSAFWWP